jgi:hypothetical protein
MPFDLAHLCNAKYGERSENNDCYLHDDGSRAKKRVRRWEENCTTLERSGCPFNYLFSNLL